MKHKPAAEELIRSYPLLQLITEMTRPINRINMTSLLVRFVKLKQKSEIRFNIDVVNQLNAFSSRRFENTDYLMQIDHIS